MSGKLIIDIRLFSILKTSSIAKAINPDGFFIH